MARRPGGEARDGGLIVVSTADMPAEAMFATLCCAALTMFAGSPETIAVPTASMPAAVVVAAVNPASTLLARSVPDTWWPRPAVPLTIKIAAT